MYKRKYLTNCLDRIRSLLALPYRTNSPWKKRFQNNAFLLEKLIILTNVPKKILLQKLCFKIMFFIGKIGQKYQGNILTNAQIE